MGRSICRISRRGMRQSTIRGYSRIIVLQGQRAPKQSSSFRPGRSETGSPLPAGGGWQPERVKWELIRCAWCSAWIDDNQLLCEGHTYKLHYSRSHLVRVAMSCVVRQCQQLTIPSSSFSQAGPSPQLSFGHDDNATVSMGRTRPAVECATARKARDFSMARTRPAVEHAAHYEAVGPLAGPDSQLNFATPCRASGFPMAFTRGVALQHRVCFRVSVLRSGPRRCFAQTMDFRATERLRKEAGRGITRRWIGHACGPGRGWIGFARCLRAFV